MICCIQYFIKIKLFLFIKNQKRIASKLHICIFSFWVYIITGHWGVLMKNWSNTSLRYSDLENWLKILIIINLVFKLEIKPRKLSELNEFLAKFDLGGMLSLWSATAQWSLSGRSALYGDSSTQQWIIHYDIEWFTSSQFLNYLFNKYNQHIAFYSRQSHPDTLLIFLVQL